ncbi:MAG: DUF11 domain-containing protein [Deltaproteobacteria bacterium]|nr:DUF11 domain-containing protein [Deltaproteobacteria bacterium]
MNRFRMFVTVMAALALVASFAATAGAQSVPSEPRVVYALGNVNATFAYPVNVFLIWDDELIPAETLLIDPEDEFEPVGITVDSLNKRVFIAPEHGDALGVLNAENGELLSPFTIESAGGLAGLEVVENQGDFYVADLTDYDMFVYDLETLDRIDEWVVSGGSAAFGVAVSSGLLYLGNGSNVVPIYNVYTHEQVGDFEIADMALAIDVWEMDPPRVFTSPGFTTNFVTRYDLGTGVETQLDLGTIAKGLAVNSDAGLLYQLAGSGILPETSLRVIDAETLTELSSHPLGDGTWSPTDVKIGSNSFGRRVAVDLIGVTERVFDSGQTVTFEIIVTNDADSAIETMPFEVLFHSDTLTYVSATPASDASDPAGSVTWTDITANQGENLAPGESFTIIVEFTAQVPPGCAGSEGDMVIARMVGASLGGGGTVEDSAGSTRFAVLCPCADSAVCDDGLFCTGVEICDSTNQCEDGDQPCEIDEICNEETDSCDPLPGADDDDDLPEPEADDDDDSSGQGGCGC